MKKGSLRKIVRLIAHAKLPWWLYILQLGIVYYSTTLFVSVTDMTGRIAAGEIFDRTLVDTYILLMAIQVLLGFLPILSSWVTVIFDRKLQTRVWCGIIDLPMAIVDAVRPTGLISRVTQDALMLGQFIELVLSFLQAALMTVMTVLALFSYTPQLTLMVLPVIVLYVLYTVFLRDYIYAIQYDTSGNLSRYTQFLNEKLVNMKLIKATVSEEQERTAGLAINEERFRIQLRSVKYDVISNAFQQLMNMLVVGTVLIGGAWFVQKGALRLEVLIAFFLFSLNLPGTFQNLVQTLLEIVGVVAGTEVISTSVDYPKEQPRRQCGMDTLEHKDIVLDKVSFSYDGETPVLKDISGTIPYGKTVAIIGRSGCGKTTLLKLLERLYTPTSGTIRMGGEEAENIHLDQWRRAFGYVIQNSPLITGTVADNLRYGTDRDISEGQMIAALKTANAWEFVEKLPEGLQSDLGLEASYLSGGQQQRLAVARGIVGDPDFLLMDEATANMDKCNEEEVTDHLRAMMADKTTVVVAHNLLTVVSADEIWVMNDGRIVARGDHRTLYAQCALYREFYDFQAKCLQ